VTTARVKPRPSTRENIRANLIVARARARLTQAELAELAGVARQTISELERGTLNISVDKLDSIAVALKIDVQRLFTPPVAGTIDAEEINRRRSTPRAGFIPARALHAAIQDPRRRNRRKNAVKSTKLATGHASLRT
jgi:transcriptional regulator with XRE-family HTH domain